MRRRVLCCAGVLLLAAVASGSGAAVADSLPPYTGMSFPSITGPSGPSEFSWEVQLSEGQALEQIDDQQARVYYTESLVTAFSIFAEAARDAHGATVPTSLVVSGSNVVTLFVHHQEGNPAAGGAPFVYPITAGPGWEGGFSTIYVQLPPGEFPPRETQPTPGCLVPKLKDRMLKGAKKALGRAGCRIGEVRKLRDATARTGWVTRQSPRPGRLLAPGATVDVTLVEESA